MIEAVLDASALLALLLNEPGHRRVIHLLAGAAISTVNVAEVIGHYARKGVPEADVRLLLDPMPVERVPFDEELAYVAGLLLPATKAAGLSLGDRACLALAQRLGAKAVTADRAWLRVAKAAGVEIELIR